MRPISLAATAFGPFADKTTIDFTRLGGRTMFLIEGPIGSGKTSILDAICFALYGESSGGERDAELRSHHAKPETLTEVTFEFELGSGDAARRFRVQRAPTQERPAQRGQNRTRTVPTSATIWEVTPNGTDVATTRGGIKDVNAKVEQLIGVSANQFRQVIILPQGRFRDFLISKSVDRRTVLEKLFGAELYRRIAEVLHDTERKAEADAARARTELDFFLRRREVQSVDELITLRDETARAASARRAEATAAGTRATEAEAALAAGTEDERLIAERTSADADAAAVILEANLPARQADRARLDAGRKALPVVPVEGQVEEARKRRDTAAQDLAARRRAATDALGAVEVARARLATEEARKPEREAAKQRVQELDRLKKGVADLATLRAALVEAQTAATTADTAVTIAEAADSASAKALEDLLERIGTLREGAARLDGARAVVDTVAGQLQSRNDLEANRAKLATAVTARAAAEDKAKHATEDRAALEARIGDLRAISARQEGAALRVTIAETRLKSRQNLDADREALAIAETARDRALVSHATTVTSLEAARTHRDETFHAWTAGLAGRLATNLAEGEACPVCGSDHHPVRATVADGAPTDEDLDAADISLKSAADAERRAAEAVAACQAEVHALEGRVATATEDLGGDATVPLADLQGRKVQADLEIGAITAATAELADAEKGIEDARSAERDATEAATASRTAVDQLEGTVSAAITTLGHDATVPLADLQRRKAQADEDFQAARQATDDLADANGREPAVRQAADEARRRTAQARDASTKAQIALANAQTRTDDAAKAVPAGLATPEALAAARSDADDDVAFLEKSLAEATAQERSANDAMIVADAASKAAEAVYQDRARELEQAVATLDQVVRDAGFASVDDWRAACLTPEVIAELDDRLTAFHESLAQAQDRAARARDAATNVEAPDLAALTAAVTAAREAHTAAHDAATLKEATASELRVEVTRAEQAKRIADEALKHQTRVRKLATIARGVQGGSVPKVSFQSYVLARFLDQVLDAATQRFLKVREGQFKIRRRLEARSSGEAGLDIEIFDYFTGQARDARTLSGGETFLASLSLAFGLSDVVQQHMGGVHLDCIFVDEGFGSLDPEALGKALGMLIELQQGGRLVGIISHVGDLRQHIDARLTLTRTPNGSTAAFHV